MKIYTRSGELAFKTFDFPDGQPHFKLETYEKDFLSVTIETAIKSPADLFQVVMVSDTLRQSGFAEVNLDIRYLLGARMDRPIDSLQPFTLAVVARIINGAGFTKVRILDVHSDVATRLIRNSEGILPIAIMDQAVSCSGATVIMAPDKGASYRAQRAWGYGKNGTIIYAEKIRNSETGKLRDFKVHNYEPEKDGTSVIMIDDICDGGGTFVGLAKELRKKGASKVNLYVTHGVFSKGIFLEGIDRIFCTDSYDGPQVRLGSNRGITYPNGVPTPYEGFTVIPVSMKDLK